MSEINITPFTDVVLVLLIIFMVSTPLLLQPSIKIKLPKAGSTEAGSGRNVTIMINAAGQVYLKNREIELESLKAELSAQAASDPDVAVVINADKQVVYDKIVQVLDISKQAGVRKLALAIEYQKNN